RTGGAVDAKVFQRDAALSAGLIDVTNACEPDVSRVRGILQNESAVVAAGTRGELRLRRPRHAVRGSFDDGAVDVACAARADGFDVAGQPEVNGECLLERVREVTAEPRDA